jgi:hypothetical protein
MKALLLGGLGTLAYLAAATLLLRRVSGRRAAALVRLFLATVPGFAAVCLLTPPDLGFLPQSVTEPVPWIDLGLGLFLYAAGFFGGSLQLYNLAERGFSLRILIDVFESASGGMTEEALYRGYSGGRGIPWMYQKRLDDLREQGLMEGEGGWVSATPRGRRAAAIFRRLRAFVGLSLWA